MRNGVSSEARAWRSGEIRGGEAARGNFPVAEEPDGGLERQSVFGRPGKPAELSALPRKPSRRALQWRFAGDEVVRCARSWMALRIGPLIQVLRIFYRCADRLLRIWLDFFLIS